MVVTLANLNLWIVLINTRANRSGLSEIEWSAFDRPQLTGWNQARIDGRDPITMNLQFMPRISLMPWPARLK